MRAVRYLLRIFLTYTLVFLLFKPVFMGYHRAVAPFGAHDVWNVLLHGLPLDLSTAGYLTALPLLLVLLALWAVPDAAPRRLRTVLSAVLRGYYGLSALLLAVVLVADLVLYGFWGFKLDATVFNYMDSPRDAVASVSVGFLLGGVLMILLLAALIYLLLTVRTPQRLSMRPKKRQPALPVRSRLASTFLVLVLGSVLFLFVRGGVGKSTMNIGRAYFSEQQFLNHAAVNPAFSLIYSSFKAQRFDRLNRFMSAQACTELVDSLHISTQSLHVPQLLCTDRPHILLVLMEGFGSQFIEALGGEKGVAPQFSRLCEEGIVFRRCYANSFRTDRGTVSALSGYPAFPQLSVMKLPDKSRTLPSLARSLASAGYATDFLYGGDINFTNMKSYLLSTGYQRVEGDTSFPPATRRTHAWGVTDRIVLDTVCHRLARRPVARSWFTTVLTLASHEPWQVPYERLAGNERANSMAYLDDCIGHMVEQLRAMPLWDNLLIVFTADHGIEYPAGLTEADEHRYRIPLLWVGGAVKEARKIDLICNQSDLCATLLGQLHLPHEEYPFSRDVLSATYTMPFAFHTFANGFSFIDTTGYTVYDINAKHLLTDAPHPSAQRLEYGKALLQAQTDDLARR